MLTCAAEASVVYELGDPLPSASVIAPSVADPECGTPSAPYFPNDSGQTDGELGPFQCGDVGNEFL